VNLGILSCVARISIKPTPPPAQAESAPHILNVGGWLGGENFV
jgi:hypothetical protein